MLPALIAAGGSLLGGLLGRSKPISADAQSYGNVKGLMRAAEKYGINPLTLIGGGVSGGSGIPGDNSSMGAGIADAAMLLGDSLAKKTDAAKLQQAQAQNQKLQQQVTSLTIRPKVPGIYGPPMLGGPSRVQSTSPDNRLDDPVVLPDGASGGVGVPDPRLDRASGVYVAGTYVEPAPGWSPAQVFEDNYGDVASAAFGFAKMGADFLHTRKKRNEVMRSSMTVGEPLAIPFGFGPSRVGELLPGVPSKLKSKKPKLSEYWTHSQTGYTGKRQ